MALADGAPPQPIAKIGALEAQMSAAGKFAKKLPEFVAEGVVVESSKLICAATSPAAAVTFLSQPTHLPVWASLAFAGAISGLMFLVGTWVARRAHQRSVRQALRRIPKILEKDDDAPTIDLNIVAGPADALSIDISEGRVRVKLTKQPSSSDGLTGSGPETPSEKAEFQSDQRHKEFLPIAAE